jgi:hypothetical protein
MQHGDNFDKDGPGVQLANHHNSVPWLMICGALPHVILHFKTSTLTEVANPNQCTAQINITVCFI